MASASEFIEPTQGFDCHESVISPDARDSLQNKFDRSQVCTRSLACTCRYSLALSQVLACSLAVLIGCTNVTRAVIGCLPPRQIYLYEINKLLQPSARPRQVLPYAVLTFTLQGAYLAAVDAEPTAEQRLASAARLQQAVAQQLNNNVIGESVNHCCRHR